MARAKTVDATPPRTRVRQTREVRRVELVEAARSAFVNDGYAGTSMRQIATAAGVNQALLYQHFSSKQELFEVAVLAPLKELGDDLLEEGRLIAVSDPDAKGEHVAAGIRALLTAMSASAPLVASLLFNSRELGQQLYSERMEPLFLAIAEASAADLEGWGDPDRDFTILVPAVFSMCFGLAMNAHFSGQQLDVDAVAPQLARFVVKGIGVSGRSRMPRR